MDVPLWRAEPRATDEVPRLCRGKEPIVKTLRFPDPIPSTRSMLDEPSAAPITDAPAPLWAMVLSFATALVIATPWMLAREVSRRLRGVRKNVGSDGAGGATW